MLRHLRNVALLLYVQRSSRYKNCWIGGQMLDNIYLKFNSKQSFTQDLTKYYICPLLFIIYINDISMVPLSVGSMLLYADDSMLYRPIRTPDDYIQLQMDIDKLCVWTKNNLM